MELTGVVLRFLEVLCDVVSATCLVVIAFELSPWKRKE
jgi:hypothetical protein